MTDIEATWDLERGYWLNGSEHYRRHLADDAMMVFPYPVGLLIGVGIISELEGAPRWNSIEFVWKEQIVRDGWVTLAYEAVGQRDGSPPYRALCATVHVRGKDTWMLILHQQTPVDMSA